MYNVVSTLVPSFVIRLSFFLTGNKDNYNILDGFKFGKIEPGSVGLGEML